MKNSIKKVLDHHQIRNKASQKQEFANWLESHLQDHDYEITRHEYKRNRANLIVGDYKTAEIILTAHYDTPPTAIIPLGSPIGNIFQFIFGQFFFILPLAPILILPYLAPQSAFLSVRLSVILNVLNVLAFLWLIQMVMGFANKNNANDNTSGVATLISILEDLPKEQRKKVCVVFFDEEEKGLIGASCFKNDHKGDIKNKPFINFDCVANGKTLIFACKKAFRDSKYYNLLTESAQTKIEPKRKALIGTAWQYIIPSDQILFKNAVGVVSAYKAPIIGHYLKNIHNKSDTKFDNENIELLTATLLNFIERI